MDFKAWARKEWVVLFGIAVIFLALRLPAVHRPYHQDEYKWPIIVNPALTEPGGIPHPPLGEAIYRATFNLVGSDNFRLTPLVFGFANLLLIYFIVKRRYGMNAAQWTSLFFTLSFYSILASLMVDTDGQILPFFFLLGLWFYDSFNSAQGKKRLVWLALFFASLAAGLLVKVSFILAIGAFVLDFLFEKKIFADRKKTAKALGWGVVGVLLIASLLYLSTLIFPFFDLRWSMKYWEGFMKGFGGRNFLQTGIQFVKALFYLSPALALGGLLSLYPYRRDLKLFHIFIGLGLVFYLVLFDFSSGALDRYFQFMIVPLCIILGVLVAEVLDRESKIMNYAKNKKFLLLLILSFIIFLTQFLPQYVPPLYPKTEWLSRILSLKWDFLYPFFGGSGPLGFYVSFLFIALSFALSAVLAALAFLKKEMRPWALALLLAIGLVYSLVFAEEYLFGKMNGSAPDLVEASAAFIKNDPDIKKVMVYNDNGGYNIRQTGKYARRLYATPQFEKNYEEIFRDYYGHILYIDIPPVGAGNLYAAYLDSCRKIYKKSDKYITAEVLDCTK